MSLSSDWICTSGLPRQIFRPPIDTHLKHVSCKNLCLDFEGKSLFFWLHKTRCQCVSAFLSYKLAAEKPKMPKTTTLRHCLFLVIFQINFCAIIPTSCSSKQAFSTTVWEIRVLLCRSDEIVMPKKSLTKVFFSLRSTVTGNVLLYGSNLMTNVFEIKSLLNCTNSTKNTLD